MKKYLVYILTIVISISCQLNDSAVNEEKIASVNNELLLKSDLTDIIPQGLSKEDSISFLNQYVLNWIKDQLVLQKAEELLPEKTKNVERRRHQHNKSILQQINYS